MYKTLELTLDTERTNNTKTNAQNFLVNTNDYESVKIIADIVQDKERVDLSDATVKLAIRKPDQTIVFQDGTVTAAIEGECEFVLGTQSYVLKGTHVAEVMIYFLDGKVVVTRAFAYHVAEGILSDTAIESTSWYQDVNELQLAVQELQVEVDAFIATAVEETRAEITEVDQRLTSQLAETGAQVGISVESFGAIGDGTTDDTAAFAAAINHCNANQKNLELASKTYLITGELPFPNRIIIRGKGHSTNLRLSLTAGKVAFKATAWVYSFGFEGLRFTVASGASKDVGAIRTDYCLRGAYIKDIWTFELYTPFYFGDSVWGLLAIDNVFSYLNENINTLDKVALYGSGNTIMINNIEIVGGWKTGLKLETVFVSKLHKFNIAGSSDTIQLREAIVLIDCNTVSAQDGWIEQLDDVYWPNGKGWAVYVKDSSSIELNNILVNTGGVYSDNSDVKATNIKFSQFSGGFRTLNNGKIQTDSRDIRYCDYQDGDIVVNGLAKSNRGLVGVPNLKRGIAGAISGFITSTNAGISTLDYFHTDFISGDASVKATTSATNHGIKITSPKVIANELYTVSVKVKKVSGVKLLKLATESGTTRTTLLPSTDQRTIGDGQWHTLSLVCSSSSDVINLKLLAELVDGSSTGVFVLDSVDVHRGYSDFDPSKHVPNITFQYRGASKPTGSGWVVGDKVYNSAPAAGGYEGWVCTSSDGTVSVWKGFGLIEV